MDRYARSAVRACFESLIHLSRYSDSLAGCGSRHAESESEAGFYSPVASYVTSASAISVTHGMYLVQYGTVAVAPVARAAAEPRVVVSMTVSDEYRSQTHGPIIDFSGYVIDSDDIDTVSEICDINKYSTDR